MSIQSEYAGIDFSKFSRVKDTLLHRLHQERRVRGNRVELGMEDLDYVAAAGTRLPPHADITKPPAKE